MKKIIFLLIFSVSLAGCGSGPKTHYYLVAKRAETGLMTTLTLTVIRKFETKNWCEAEKESMEKREFQTECLHDAVEHEGMFQGKAVGKWYVIQRYGRFPSSVIIYDYDPPLPDAVMLAQLRKSAPHVLKFAAVHRAPAKVRIFSPTGKEYASTVEQIPS